MLVSAFWVTSCISGQFFGFFSNLVTPIDLILFPLVLCFSPVGFDGSHHYPATILDLTVFLYFCISGGPETREGATFEQNFFSDICSARYSSIENLMHYMKFQKKVLVNRSNGDLVEYKRNVGISFNLVSEVLS